TIPDDKRGSKTVLDEKRGSKSILDHDEKTGHKNIPDEKKKDQSLILNVLFQFLFAELKDTARVRRWAARKMNAEFDEMLTSTTGKLMNQIQVRDFNFGSSFPLVESVELRHVQLSNDEEIIQTVDVELDIDYEGGFQLTLDVDIIFGAWAYLSISVTKLAGRGRLQLTRVPFTHWSFSFYEEPRMEFNVDSRFNGRPIPQISSLIVNQIKRTIRKKHVLPSYKMRYKPLFVKPEESFVNPDICFHGHRLGPGQLSVKVLKCSRLQELSPESKLFCTLSVDKEEIEEVWRQSWVTLDMTLRILPNAAPGFILKDQLSGDKTEKKRVVVDSITQDSPAAEAGFQRGDIVETVGNVRVLSFKHAMKQLKSSTESVTIRVKRQSRLALDPSPYLEQPEDLEFEEHEMNGDIQDDIGDFVSIDIKHQRSSSLNAEVQPSQESVKLSEKLTRKLQSGKKKILGLKESERDRDNSDTKSLLAEEESVQSTDKNVCESISVASCLRDGSQSAKSSPQKQLIEINRQRAHSDTSLNKVQTGDSDTVSASSDIGSYSYPELQRRIGEVATREITFSSDPEWNEEFEFDCKEEDQYVNVCVWCKMAQTDRASKNISTINKADGPQLKNTPPTDDLPSYDLTTKIGYVSVPLADITAGCLLTMQGDTQYTMYLHPPEETITASRTKLPYSGHIGFDKNICHGDITLSFVHKPFKTIESVVRKEIIRDVLNPPAVKIRAKSLEREQLDGQHSFRPCQFASKTYCDFCGKKIWLKGGLKCSICKMVCHKKCVEKCYIQTKCSREGPKMSGKPEETWVPPLRGQEMEKEEGKVGKFFKFRQKEQPSLPLNIPHKNIPNRAQASSSPSRSPLRSPSPFASLSEHVDRHLTVSGMKKNLSNKSLPGMERVNVDDDSDDEFRYRHPTYSLDDNVVIEAKERGKELYANLSLPDRKKTLDDMVTKLQDTIDKESEYKSELMKNYQEITDIDQRRLVSQQLEKCDEKIEALMMMMVHYCAGLQHCLDQEEAHKRLLNMEPTNDDDDDVVTEDSGIQFVVTDS
ncbi:PDZ domain-containing protein 8-like, partial [Mercenaria mercenaria]|uniref:PDZ domain-containing protein 8-like n=2 Tax=Mercenaria mercenaria TaxID=6596 RepID=UPI00234F0DFE